MTTVTYKTLQEGKKQKKTNGKCCCARLPWYGKVGLGVVGFVVVAVVTTILVYRSFGPLHASCKVSWKVSAPACDTVRNKILKQMEDWAGEKGCDNGGEKCLYTITSKSNNSIRGKHKTPKKHYVDDLTFNFKAQQNVCEIMGYSRSETWYAVLDYGTNFCNLRNLIDGAGISNMTGFTEHTSNADCTQYTSANCEKY